MRQIFFQPGCGSTRAKVWAYENLDWLRGGFRKFLGERALLRIPIRFANRYGFGGALTFARQRRAKVSGAGDGGRTRDIQLGKLALYQLSYTRISTRLKLI